MFRIAKVDGVIEIDGIDTGTIALEDLRKSISIIPQLPVLFSGTLRRNLDPFGEFSDDLLWKVLQDVSKTYLDDKIFIIINILLNFNILAFLKKG